MFYRFFLGYCIQKINHDEPQAAVNPMQNQGKQCRDVETMQDGAICLAVFSFRSVRTYALRLPASSV